MIACNSDTCKILWFHTECLKISQIPIGKWHCQEDNSLVSYLKGMTVFLLSCFQSSRLVHTHIAYSTVVFTELTLEFVKCDMHMCINSNLMKVQVYLLGRQRRFAIHGTKVD